MGTTHIPFTDSDDDDDEDDGNDDVKHVIWRRSHGSLFIQFVLREREAAVTCDTVSLCFFVVV